MSEYKDTVQKAYIAYYGRPADPEGLYYWIGRLEAEGGSFNALIDAFGNSEESISLYNGYSGEALIEAIYLQLLGREAESGGLNYYVTLLNTGQASAANIAQRIFDGASGDDATMLNNKLGVANKFTDSLNTDSKIASYAGDYAASKARELIDAVTVDTIVSLVDTDGVVSSIIASSSAITGSIYVLYDIDDVVQTTWGNDVIIAQSSTFNAGDVIIDSAANRDNDKLELTLTSAGEAASVSNIENINVKIDSLAGNTSSYDASNTLGATITMNIGKALDGKATIHSLGANKAVAGDLVEYLTLTGVGSTMIDMGNAIVGSFDAATPTDDVSIVINGNALIEIGHTTAFDRVELNLTDEATLVLGSLTQTGNVVITGDSDLTLVNAGILSADKITTTGAGFITANISKADAVDATLWSAVDSILVSVDMNGAGITTASGSIITVNRPQTSMQLISGTTNVEDVITLKTRYDHATDLTFTDFESVKLVVDAPITIDSLVLGSKVAFLGTASTITVLSSDASLADFTSFEGEINYRASGDVIIGSGIGGGVFYSADANLVFGGDDSTEIVDLSLANGKTQTIELGAGNDMLVISDTLDNSGVATLYLDGGSGTDTLFLTNGTSLVENENDITLISVEKILVENVTVDDPAALTDTNDTLAVTLPGHVLTLRETNISTEEAGDDLTVNITVTSQITNLSDITHTNVDTFNILGRGYSDDIIIGTPDDDVFYTGNAGLSVSQIFSGVEGKDTYVFDVLESGVAAADVFDERLIVQISDFVVIGSDYDSLDISATDVEADSSGIDVSAATIDMVDGAMVAVTASVDDGEIRLAGDDQHLQKFDTLAEWVKVADILFDQTAGDGLDGALFFEFEGDTFVVTDQDTSGVSELTGIIKLAGTIGVTGLTFDGYSPNSINLL